MDVTESTKILKALADTSRLRILNCLLESPRYVEELAERLGLSASTVSFHLKKLEQVGLLTSRREQYYVVYSANDELLDLSLRRLVALPDLDRAAQERRASRYFQKVLDTFFVDGRLERLPAQRKKRLIVLEEFAREFELGRDYDEPEVNAIINRRHEDHCLVRRELIDAGIMERTGRTYRRIKQVRAAGPLRPEAHPVAQPGQGGAPMEGGRRKQLTRDYKSQVAVSGIYWVRNKVSGKVLLGSSTNIHGPLNRHEFELRFGSHRCAALLRDWRELGPDSFEFKVLETVEVEETPEFDAEAELAKLERQWIARLRPFSETCYNGNERIRTQVF